MTYAQALILGVVEGITEFLPVSSTGHLILASKLFGLESTEFLKTFEIAIQAGAILAVLVLYAKYLMSDWRVIRLLLAAFAPTAVLGFIFYKLIKRFLLANSMLVLLNLFLGGILLVVFEKFYKEKKSGGISEIKSLSYGQAFLIGLFQSAALLPGVSRSAATVVGGLSIGVNRKTIVVFSFLLAIPTMLAATGLDVIRNASIIQSTNVVLLGIGLVTSFVMAALSIRFLLRFIQNHSFLGFGIYRILVAGLCWFVIGINRQ